MISPLTGYQTVPTPFETSQRPQTILNVLRACESLWRVEAKTPHPHDPYGPLTEPWRALTGFNRYQTARNNAKRFSEHIKEVTRNYQIRLSRDYPFEYIHIAP